jgi:histidinol-phosphate aminotransferase
MITAPSPLPHILATKPYVPGGKLQGHTGRVRLMASNENPLGPSAKAVAALQALAASAHVYPDPEYRALRTAIASAAGIADAGRIVVSSGSDEIINLLTQAYAGAGDEVLFTTHAFSMYDVSARAHGAVPVRAPETELRAGINAILGMVSARTRVLFLATPNNPTGTMLSLDELAALQDALPPHVMFALDGAYAEYVGPEYEAGLRNLVDRRETTVMIRTFSKIHGLAALRLGWGYMPASIADVFQRLRSPFNVNAMAVAAGIASIADAEHVQHTRAYNAGERARLLDGLNALGLTTPQSHANFVIPDFGSAERAEAANVFLKAEGILIRPIAGYGLPTRLRITVGIADDNTAVLDALARFTR